MGILKNTREFKAPGAGKEHTSEVRGGGRDPGVRRPGSGLGRPTARSKFLCVLLCFIICDFAQHVTRDSIKTGGKKV